MAEKGIVNLSDLGDIGDAIRGKNGSTQKYHVSEMAGVIELIDTDPSGDATAIAADLLTGKTAYAKGVKLTGTATQASVTVTGTEMTITGGIVHINE